MKDIPVIKVKKSKSKVEAVRPPEGYVFDSLLNTAHTSEEPPYQHTFKVEGVPDECGCEIRLEGVDVVERVLCDYHKQGLVRLEIEEDNATI
jgi:hypothetical protein